MGSAHTAPPEARRGSAAPGGAAQARACQASPVLPAQPAQRTLAVLSFFHISCHLKGELPKMVA